MNNLQKLFDLKEIEKIYDNMSNQQSYGKIILHFEKGKVKIIQQEVIVKLTNKKEENNDSD